MVDKKLEHTLNDCPHGPKNYFMYYLNIIPVISFLIGPYSFASYMAYALVQHYLTDNPENPEIINQDEQIYGEIYKADWW